MTRDRATDEEQAYWKKLRDANAVLASDSAPAMSMTEVFERMESIRARFGFLAEPGLPPDDDRAIDENRKLRARFLARARRGA